MAMLYDRINRIVNKLDTTAARDMLGTSGMHIRVSVDLCLLM